MNRIHTSKKSFQHADEMPCGFLARSSRTWVMVAGAEKVSVFEKTGFGSLRLIESLKPSKSGSNKSIRTTLCCADKVIHFDPGLYSYYDINETLNFAHRISAWLDEAVWNDSFDYLVVVASPKILADLHHVLSAPVKGRIIHTIESDMTRLEQNDLKKRLLEIIAFAA